MTVISQEWPQKRSIRAHFFPRQILVSLFFVHFFCVRRIFTQVCHFRSDLHFFSGFWFLIFSFFFSTFWSFSHICVEVGTHLQSLIHHIFCSLVWLCVCMCPKSDFSFYFSESRKKGEIERFSFSNKKKCAHTINVNHNQILLCPNGKRQLCLALIEQVVLLCLSILPILRETTQKLTITFFIGYSTDISLGSSRHKYYINAKVYKVTEIRKEKNRYVS